MGPGTYDEQFEVNLLGVIEIDVLVDLLNLLEHFFFVLFFNEGTCTASVFAQISSDRSVEVGQVDHSGRYVRLLQLVLYI